MNLAVDRIAFSCHLSLISFDVPDRKQRAGKQINTTKEHKNPPTILVSDKLFACERSLVFWCVCGVMLVAFVYFGSWRLFWFRFWSKFGLHLVSFSSPAIE